MEESRSVPQTVQSSLETPNRVIVLVETLRRLHVHRIALRHGRVPETNTGVTEQNGEVLRQSHRNQRSRDFGPSIFLTPRGFLGRQTRNTCFQHMSPRAVTKRKN